ncbi:sugar ABC transporter substrate-binding protein [Pseudomonas ogarae]|uniref:Ribose ABC transporter substrate-binding protein RbsB n=1 Tax=Pseudomonas ogarae (strain DSM 112162 / CECT 30235 / F113) TaxID=1114970 RepID=A0ABM6QZD6_PSEO1|nr:sugar ABC transporter substrate-binding protein [Pseudomonas ogarae]AEV62036.1 Inositol transport system sugar-binding protein [Pseudomonas ogarae]AUO45903.1 ribose ABC transporter substrate-binding protein RbsB [Pseudomonas ogarae]
MKKRLLTYLFAALFTPLALADIRIGVSIAQVDDVFLAQMRDYMAAHAKELPGVTLQFEDAQGDVVRQLNQVQNFTAQSMDAIIVNPVDTAATQKITNDAQKAGVPLVYVNRRPDQAELPTGVGYVGSDEIKAGEMQMRYLAEKMGGKGNLAIMLGLLSNNATHNRTQGVKEVLKSYPDIHVVEEQSAEWQRSKAMDLMNNWIVSGKKIDAVAANADEMAIGAAMAISQAGMHPGKDILVGGSDGGPAGLDAIKKDQLLVTVYQDNKGQAIGSIDLALKMIRKEPYTAQLTIPYQLITKANYQDFLNP